MFFVVGHFNISVAQLLSATLTEAVAKLLDNNKSPSRKGKELDNRGSSFYIAQYALLYNIYILL